MDCAAMFKGSQKAQTLRREDTRGHAHNVIKSVFVVLGAEIDGPALGGSHLFV